ncbi:MAG: glucokinase, partial [Gammaproteobacteria bacterium]
KHVSLETVLSGGGLYKIYQFLRDTNQYSESFVVKNEMLNNDPAQIITEHALANEDELCSKTLDLFISIYGSIAGDIALHYYPVDELLIAGGIAPRLKNKIASQEFINAFLNKGLMSENMQKITVKLILNDKVGLYGALSCAKNQ